MRGLAPGGELAVARGEFASFVGLNDDRRTALGLFLRHLARGERVAKRGAAWCLRTGRKPPLAFFADIR